MLVEANKSQLCVGWTDLSGNQSILQERGKTFGGEPSTQTAKYIRIRNFLTACFAPHPPVAPDFQKSEIKQLGAKCFKPSSGVSKTLSFHTVNLIKLQGPARKETYEEAFSRVEGEDPVRKLFQDSSDINTANLFGRELDTTEFPETDSGAQQQASSRTNNERGKPQGHHIHGKAGINHSDSQQGLERKAKLHTRPGIMKSEHKTTAASGRRGRKALLSDKANAKGLSG